MKQIIKIIIISIEIILWVVSLWANDSDPKKEKKSTIYMGTSKSSSYDLHISESLSPESNSTNIKIPSQNNITFGYKYKVTPRLKIGIEASKSK